MINKQGVRKWFLFLIAFVVSCMIWYMVVADSDSKISINLGDVEVTLIGKDSIQEKGYAVYVTDSTKIDVTVTVAQEKGWLVSASNLRLRADLNELTSFQTESILYLKTEILSNASVIGNNYKLEKNYITVRTEKLIDENIPVTVETAGTPANGYVAAEGTPEADHIHCLVPESYAGTGIYAVAVADVTDYKADYEGAAKLFFYDASGEVLDINQIQIFPDKNTMEVKIPIGNLTKITLGVPDPESIIMEGRKCIAVMAEQSEFSVVCAPGKQSEGISVSIPVSAFDNLEVNSDTEETSNMVSLHLSDYLPAGYSLYRNVDDDLGIEVVSRLLKKKTIYISTSGIQMNSPDAGYSAVLKEGSCAIIVEATGEYLDLLTTDKVEATLNISGLKTGSNAVTPQVTLKVEDTDIQEYTILSVGKVYVILSEVEDVEY